MTNFSNINRTRLCLIICLKSIKINRSKNILSNNIQKFTKSRNPSSYNYLKNKSQSSYIKSLHTIHDILNSTKKKYEKNKIISILEYYSNKNRYSNSEFHLTFAQYMARFNYRYIKYYKYNLINKEYKNNNHINNISIIYLYLLHKTLKTHKKFYIYKNLKL